ncbi:MAG: 5-(carboxyamino)imidazole ribonucleotide synthase [bacterium]|nr:5-(carboxyamino)imidazole ribonucleotide synthase [bacterium]
MKKIFQYPLMKIGIIGGGQLGKMMALKAKKMGFAVTVLDPTPNCPAAQIADRQLVATFYDANKLNELVQKNDVTTQDIEHINIDVLKNLVDKGHRIYPSPYLVEVIQDKLKQKERLTQAGIPVPKYDKVISPEFLNTVPVPFVYKARKGGYDGRGLRIIRNRQDLAGLEQHGMFVEEYVDIEKELAVMVARNTVGEIVSYPVVEMVFNPRANICELVIAPARIDPAIANQVQQIAVNTVEILDGVGVFGIEMFLTKSGKILVNEIAPRPHNSGHYTIESCMTCQFEQHIRAIAGLPLGATAQLSPAVMLNILGEEGSEGPPVIEGLPTVLAIPGVSFHFYGKKICRPYRKMGHITIVDKQIECALEKAKEVKQILKVKAEV